MSGHTVVLESDRWAYRDELKTVSLPFVSLRAKLSAPLFDSFTNVLDWYVRNTSPGYLISTHHAFCTLVNVAFEQGGQVKELQGVDVLNLQSVASITVVARVCALIRRWEMMKLPGVTDAAQFLKSFRLGAGPKGVAVLTRDPVMGPYTDIEWGAIQDALDNAFADGQIEEDAYCLAWLFLALGQRPIQYAGLKVCDLTRQDEGEHGVRYVLLIPRAKQGQRHHRSEFTERRLLREIAEPIYQYAQKVQATFEGKLSDPSQAPLFAATERGDGPPGFEFHRTAASLTLHLNKALKCLKLYSERTGRRLHISPIRFRRTVGTRAAQEGHGELVIAQLLDHTDTQNVGVYVAAVPQIAQRIDRAMALHLAPLAQAFKGIVVAQEACARRGDDSSSRILDLRIDQSGRAMGICGQYALCQFSAPIACYTCRSFQPWLDGPHESVLEFLLKRRDQWLEPDPRIAAIHDRTILAVAQVIQICQERKGLKS